MATRYSTVFGSFFNAINTATSGAVSSSIISITGSGMDVNFGIGSATFSPECEASELFQNLGTGDSEFYLFQSEAEGTLHRLTITGTGIASFSLLEGTSAAGAVSNNMAFSLFEGTSFGTAGIKGDGSSDINITSVSIGFFDIEAIDKAQSFPLFESVASGTLTLLGWGNSNMKIVSGAVAKPGIRATGSGSFDLFKSIAVGTLTIIGNHSEQFRLFECDACGKNTADKWETTVLKYAKQQTGRGKADILIECEAEAA